MNSNFNIEVAKMRSLIERIEKPHTNYQAVLNEAKCILEAKNVDRTEYDNLIDLLYNKAWKANTIVSLGYVINASTPASVYPSAENDAELDNVISGSNGAEWGKKLQGIKDNPKWGNILAGKGKSSSFRGGSLSVIAIVPYEIHWQTGDKFNDWYNERMNGENALATKWGVNPMERMQDKEANKEKQNSRVFYVGKYQNGSQPIFSGRIGDFKNGETARYNDGSEKLALKHVKNFVKKGKARYFYLSESGVYEEIPGNVMSFLTYKLGGKKAQEAVAEVEEESQSYEEELKRYKNDTNKLIQQFILRQIGYLVATVNDVTTGAKEPIVYVNKNVDASETSKPFDVDQNALYSKLREIAIKTKAEDEAKV